MISDFHLRRYHRLPLFSTVLLAGLVELDFIGFGLKRLGARNVAIAVVAFSAADLAPPRRVVV